MVPIELDKQRNLKFDLRAIKDLETQMGGKPLMQVIYDVTNLGVTAIVACLWAGLKHEDAGLTVPLTTRIFQKYLDDGRSMKVIGKALVDALTETGLLKSEADELEGNEQTAPAQT